MTWRWQWLALVGWGLGGAGLAAWFIAATFKLLPHDVSFLGMTGDDLCSLQACRIVHFMVHDRVSFGGSIMAAGAVYLWLAARPLARGEAWAWWALALSGAVGFASFLAYLGFGYLDHWHGRATLLLLAAFVIGLARTWPRDGPRSLLEPAMRPALRSRAGAGRAFMLFTAVGMILGGTTIMTLGMTRVFVPQDLEFMRITADELHALNPRLVPLIAHDRAGFGGGIASCGLAILLTVWRAAKPGARELWWVLLFAGVVGFGAAIGIHPVVGYNSFTHLLPAMIGAGAFAVGIALLREPMCRPESPQ